MSLSKKDIPYFAAAIFLAAVAAIAVGNPDSPVGLYTMLGLVGVVVVMAIIINPSLGAYILVVAVFTNISDNLTFQGYPSVIKPLVVVVFGAMLVRNFYVGQIPVDRPKTARIEIFLIIFFFAQAATFLVAADKDIALGNVFDFAKDIIIMYCILFALRQPFAWKVAIWMVILATGVMCLLGLYQTVTGNYQQEFIGLASVKMDTDIRLAGPINEPNMWGQVLVAVAALILFRFLHERSQLVKLTSISLFLLVALEILNTYSRGAYLALSIVVILILFVFEKRFNPLVAFVIFGGIILLLPFLPADYINRFQTLTSLTSTSGNGIYQDDSFVGRTSEIRTGIAMFADHPLLGVGVGNYPINYQKYAQLIGLEFRSEAREAHSLYVEILAETGVIGIFSFFGFVFSLFSALLRARRDLINSPYSENWLPHINAFLVTLIGYLFAAIFLHGAYIRYFWVLSALAMTAIHLTDELLNRYKQSSQVEAIL